VRKIINACNYKKHNTGNRQQICKQIIEHELVNWKIASIINCKPNFRQERETNALNRARFNRIPGCTTIISNKNEEQNKCEECGEEMETREHILGKCFTYKRKRNKYVNKILAIINKYSNIQITELGTTGGERLNKAALLLTTPPKRWTKSARKRITKIGANLENWEQEIAMTMAQGMYKILLLRSKLRRECERKNSSTTNQLTHEEIDSTEEKEQEIEEFSSGTEDEDRTKVM
jgi:hypothetical protein